MTHLIIQITDIEDRISELRKLRETAPKDMNYFYNSAISELIVLKEFSEQISLNEMDAEEKAILNAPIDTPEDPAYPNHSDTDIFIVGYKQALKDLSNVNNKKSFLK